jgi:N4-gp56 family major capsid protein
MKEFKEIKYNSHLFDVSYTLNTTGSAGLTDEMKTYYSDYLLDIASPLLVHSQFGQKHPIPKNGGKTIEFRKYSPLAKAVTPLTEGVTPDGKSLTMSTVTATINQYGAWVPLTDILLLTAIDNNLVQATELLGDQAGRTLDTLTRNEILAGATSVQYGDGSSKTSISQLTADDKLTVPGIFRAVRTLKKNLAKPIDGSYVAIIHPDIAYDIMTSDQWIDIQKYSNTTNIYEGEIGKIGGVRFVETTEAAIDVGAASGGRDAYVTLFLGANAYGVTEVEGGGLEHIVKQLGSAGTADPLNQRATVGWKATHVAKMLVPEYALSVITCSSFSDGQGNDYN